jgi:hypothetical protein
VSIKKKFATAVATASILAGIFGSAFAPSAMAARVNDPKPRYTELTVGADIYENDDADAWGFYSADSDADDTSAADAAVVFTLFSAGSAGVGTDEIAVADLKVASSSSKLLVALPDTDGGEDCTDMESDEDDIFGQSDELGDVVETNAGDGDYTVCLAASSSTGSVKDATVTISARDGDSSGAYTTVATMTVSVFGPEATLTLSIVGGYKYVATDNVAVDDWFKVIGKDAAGNVLNQGDGGVLEGVELAALSNWADNPENGDGDLVAPFDEAYAVVDDSGGAATLYGLDDGACVTLDDDDADPMAGDSFAVAVEAGDAVSNTVTITCTADGSDAVIKSIAATDEAGPQEYDDGTGDDGDLEIIATVQDGEGRPLGDGIDDLDFGGMTFAGDDDLVTELEANEIDITDVDADDYSGGEIVLSVVDDEYDFGRRGLFTYTVTIDEPDLADADEDELVATLVYRASGEDTVTISKSRNAAKTVATITLDAGEDYAFESVYFQVEKANGNVVEFRRRANGDGVATLVLARRNTTIYVYAFSETSDESDTIKVRFR